MSTIITKKCKKCGEEKPYSQYYMYASHGNQDNLKYHSKCVDCYKRDVTRNYVHHYKEVKRVKYKTDAEYKLKKTLYMFAYRRKHRVKYLVCEARKRAKKLGIEFNIEESELVVPETCPYLGVKIIYEGDNPTRRKGWVNPFCASLDRIDPTKGYIKGNVQIISVLANRMKNNATKEQLIDFSRNVLKMHGERLD